MSAPGHVTTARGEVLDMEELKRKANQKPLSAEQKAAMKDEVKPQKRVRKAINVRGNMPMRGEEKAPVAEKPKAAPAPVAAAPPVHDKNPEGKSVADFTGITVDKPVRLKGKVEDPIATADNALGDIMDELEQNTPHSRDAADIVEKEDADGQTAAKTKRPAKKG